MTTFRPADVGKDALGLVRQFVAKPLVKPIKNTSKCRPFCKCISSTLGGVCFCDVDNPFEEGVVAQYVNISYSNMKSDYKLIPQRSIDNPYMIRKVIEEIEKTLDGVCLVNYEKNFGNGIYVWRVLYKLQLSDNKQNRRPSDLVELGNQPIDIQLFINQVGGLQLKFSRVNSDMKYFMENIRRMEYTIYDDDDMYDLLPINGGDIPGWFEEDDRLNQETERYMNELKKTYEESSNLSKVAKYIKNKILHMIIWTIDEDYSTAKASKKSSDKMDTSD